MKHTTDNPTPALFTPEVLEAAVNAALITLIQHVEKEKPQESDQIDFGSLFDSPISPIESDSALQALKDGILACSDVYAEAIAEVDAIPEDVAERHPDLDNQFNEIEKAIGRSALVDAECYDFAAERFAKRIAASSGCPNALSDLFETIAACLRTEAQKRDAKERA